MSFPMQDDTPAEEVTRLPGASKKSRSDERILVLASGGRDAMVVCAFLIEAGFRVKVCHDLDALCRAIEHRAGAVLITADMVDEAASQQLANVLARQPKWSDLPVMILSATSSPEHDRRMQLVLDALGNAMVIERPIRMLQLRSVVTMALRARRYQYRMRIQGLTQPTSPTPVTLPSPETNAIAGIIEPVLANFHDGVAVFDSDWRYVYANHRAAAVAGARKEELVGKNLWGLFPEAIGGKFYSEMQRAMNSRTARAFEFHHPRVDRWFGYRVYPQTDGLIMFETDITRRVLAEHAQPGKSSGTMAINGGPIMATYQDRELRYIEIHNPLPGTSADRMINRGDHEWLENPKEGRILEEFKRWVIGHGATARRTLRVHIAGEDRYLDITAEPLRDARGKVTGLISSVLDVTAYTQLLARSSRQSEDLNRIHEHNGEFLAMLAHELRGPLAPLYNTAHVLKTQHDAPDPTHIRWAADAINRQLQRLTYAIDDMLELSQAEYGNIELHKQTVDTRDFMNQIAEVTAPALTKRQITLAVIPPADRHVRVEADPVYLGRALDCLIEALARPAPAGGEIVLRAAQSGDTVEFTVRGKSDDTLPQNQSTAFLLARRLLALQGGTVTTSQADGVVAFMASMPAVLVE